jgi:hypothetical protein
MYIYVHIFTKVLIALHMLPYEAGFGYPIGFRLSTGLVLGTNFHPKRCSDRFQVLSSGFGFGCPDTPPDSNSTRCHPYFPLAPLWQSDLLCIAVIFVRHFVTKLHILFASFMSPYMRIWLQILMSVGGRRAFAEV